MNVSLNSDFISLVMDLPVHIKQFVLCSIMNINDASERVQNPDRNVFLVYQKLWFILQVTHSE